VVSSEETGVPVMGRRLERMPVVVRFKGWVVVSGMLSSSVEMCTLIDLAATEKRLYLFGE
jgi:hypothetical protein